MHESPYLTTNLPFYVQKKSEKDPWRKSVSKKIWKCQDSASELLVGGFNPFEKYARQNGNHFPKLGMNIKNI